MSVQRNLKALGTFGHQTTSRNNPVYIQYIPRTLSYVRTNLERYPRFARLRELLGSCHVKVDEQVWRLDPSLSRAAAPESALPRSRRTGSTRSRSSRPAAISTTTTRAAIHALTDGWPKPNSSCTRSTRRSPMSSRTAGAGERFRRHARHRSAESRVARDGGRARNREDHALQVPRRASGRSGGATARQPAVSRDDNYRDAAIRSVEEILGWPNRST